MHTLEQLKSGQLAGSKRLSIAAGLNDFPEEIFALADTLEILDLSNNQLSRLPDDLPRLKKLRILFCSANRFTEFPAILAHCPQLEMIGFKANRISNIPAGSFPEALRWLILTDNQIEHLPPDIGRCGKLQKLMLSGNLLRTLPLELNACTRLELLRIAANQLDALPAWLLSLPRLAWLAYAGNPLCAEQEAVTDRSTPIRDIQWHEVQLGPVLGEGASGIIHQAKWQLAETSRPVAVKLFKGAVTSDGLPRSELAASLAAGEHPSLISVLGRLQGHPSGLAGLVMPLINPSLSNLAGPPSLDTCTRDVYAAGLRFSFRDILTLLHSIASATRHLHARGILHGDLYAHNILHACGCQPILGDFGAASLFMPGSPLAAALQQVEIRAFGCLLEELIERCPAAAETLAPLGALQTACLNETVGERPAFAEIEDYLASLSKREGAPVHA